MAYTCRSSRFAGGVRRAWWTSCSRCSRVTCSWRRASEQSITPTRYTAGVSKLVRFGTDYAPVSRGLVEALKAREDPDTGYHRLIAPTMKRGDAVHIKTGPFAGIEGIFEAQTGQERVIVLLELLGQKVRAEVAIGELDL